MAKTTKTYWGIKAEGGYPVEYYTALGDDTDSITLIANWVDGPPVLFPSEQAAQDYCQFDTDVPIELRVTTEEV